MRSLWAVKRIDSATDPLPLPLRRRKYYVYRRGIRIPTTSLRTVCTVVSAGFQPRCGMKTGTLPRNRLAASATGGAAAVSQRTPLETDGFKTSFVECKSCCLNPAEARNWSASTHAAATWAVEEAFYRGGRIATGGVSTGCGNPYSQP